MPDRNVMGLFDEDLDPATTDDVTWLEALLRTSVEPEDWPYCGTRLIMRIRELEDLMRELVDARAKAKRRSRWYEQEQIMAPAYAKLRRLVPEEVQLETVLSALDEGE